MTQAEVTPLWKRYLKAVGKDEAALPSIYDSAKSESQWQTYSDAINSISRFLRGNKNSKLI